MQAPLNSEIKQSLMRQSHWLKFALNFYQDVAGLICHSVIKYMPSAKLSNQHSVSSRSPDSDTNE